MKKYVWCCMFLFSMHVMYAQVTQEPVKEKEWEMKQYYFVLLTKGPNRNQDSATAANIQKGHMDNLTRLANEKKIVVAGPFTDNQLWRGIFIFDVPTEKEVIDLLMTDPAITSGRLAYEIHPWMTAKGVCFE